MKRTNKLTLALLVFFVGVLITACGSKSNTTNTTNNNNKGFPDDITECRNNCNDIDGRFYIDNDRLYLDAFNVTDNNTIVGGSLLQNIALNIIAPAADATLGAIECNGIVYLTDKALDLVDDLFNTNTNRTTECVRVNSTYFSDAVFGDDGDVRDSYPATLEVDDNRSDNRVALRLTISDTDTGTKSLIFLQTSSGSNVFRDTDGEGLDLTYVQGNNHMELTNAGRLIGFFQE